MMSEKHPAPLVSVIVPVYNAAEHLEECLDSIAGQTLREIEIICVDDGSRDGSLAILRRYAANDSRFKVLCQQNKYAGVARNAGMDIARGKYFVFLDADDFFEPELLELQYAQCEKHGADVGLCAADIYNEGQKAFQKSPWLLKMEYIRTQPFSRTEIPYHIFDITTNAPWNKIFSADFVRREGLRFQELQRTNDCYFVVSALALAKKIAADNTVLVHYRTGQTGNLQSSLAASPLTAFQAALAVKTRLEEAGIYEALSAQFRNWALTLCNWTYKSISRNTESAAVWKQAMKEEYLDALELRSDDSRCLNKEEHAFLLDVLGLTANSLPHEYKVSVVVAAYNVEPYIAACMESLCAQTLADIEILCVNDGSADGTLEIIRKYAGQDRRIRIIDKEKNEGLYMARKTGAQQARGKYVLFLDADDSLTPDACEKAYQLIERKGVDYLQFGCGVVNHSDDEAMGRWMEDSLNPFPVKLSGDKLLDCFYIKRRCGTGLVGKIFAADLCRQVYRHIDDFHCFVGEDIFQSFYYAYFANSFAAVRSKPLYMYEYGRGVSNQQVMALGKFELYCKMADLCKRTLDFLNGENAAGDARDAFEAMATRMAEDCCRIYGNRIAAADKQAAAEMLVSYWWDIPCSRRLLRKAIGTTLLRELRQTTTDVFPGSFRQAGAEPLVSVVIPVYNVEKYLRECLDSVVNQSLRDIEIICVNDGSPDNSMDILREYQARDGRITIITQKNAGQSAARNTGMGYARGKYLHFLDADDYLAEETLEELYRISEEKHLEALFFDFDPFTEEGAENFYSETLLQRKEYGEIYEGPTFLKTQLEDCTYMTSPCLMMVRSDFYRRTGLSFYEGIIHEDELFCFLLLMEAERVSHVKKAFYRRRIHGGSIMTSRLSHKNIIGYFTTAQEMMRYGLALENDQLRLEVTQCAYESMKWASLRKYSQLTAEEQAKVEFDNPFTQELFKALVDKKTLRFFGSRRIGKLFEKLPRPVYKAFLCLKENGLRYTLGRVLDKLKHKR